MPWLIAGTVPDPDFPLVAGPCVLAGGELAVAGRPVRVARGTPALAAAASLACGVLGQEPPQAVLAGDIGLGRGSRAVYARLVELLAAPAPWRGVTFHYLQPDVEWHNRILWKIEELAPRPFLMADAGYMYVAKMSGFARSYDLFTPDLGELAFLADEAAPHPFYTRGFLLHEENGNVPGLIARAWAGENAARCLLVKGRADLVARDGVVADRIAEPVVEAMEPIGGTGDMLAGLAAALLAAGLPVVEACSVAARANRRIGLLARPTPAFSVADLLPALPRALAEALAGRPAPEPRAAGEGDIPAAS